MLPTIHTRIRLFALAMLLSIMQCQANTMFDVSFDQAMDNTVYYKPELGVKDTGWKKAKHLYEEHILNNLKLSEQPRIPKIIHQIWLGSPFPERCNKFRDTWIKQHPDWQYILWTEKEIQELGLVNKKAYDKTKNYGAKSDIARYEILYRFGGLYVDTDFECLYPFDTFHHCCDFYAGLNCGPVFEVFNGLMASIPGHIILKECIESLGKRIKAHDRKIDSILYTSGPFFLTACIKRCFAKCDNTIVLFPTTYFYPWPYFKRLQNKRSQIERWVRPETHAIHHWHVSWSKQKVR